MTQAVPDPNPLDPEAVDDLVTRALADIEAAADPETLKAVKSAPLDDQTPLILANQKIGQLTPADRETAGKNPGGARAHLSQVLTERRQILETEYGVRVLVEESVGVTAFGAHSIIGARHLIGTFIEEIEDFSTSMGWEIAEEPGIEHEWFGFDSLNLGIDHPARRMQNTLYTDGATAGGKVPEDGRLIMCTHTSPVQPRPLLIHGVPLYVACPDKVFRPDVLDVTRTPVFH